MTSPTDFSAARTRRALEQSLAATECRKQPIVMFVDGGTLCAKCGREVKNACERSWLNDRWLENLTDEQFAAREAAVKEHADAAATEQARGFGRMLNALLETT